MDSNITDEDISNGTNYNDTEKDPCPEENQRLIGDPIVQAIFCLLYIIIFCTGVFGNVLVAIVVICKKHMQNVTNLFILNLAMSDIVMCLLCVPFTPINSFTGEWLFGETLCILFPVTQGMSVYISTLTLTIIALDRFVVIIFPYRARMQIKTCCLMIAMIDFLAILFTAPYAFHMKISIDEISGRSICHESWGGMKRKLYGAFTNIMQFVLPFITIIFCYTAIIRKLEERAAHRPGAARSAAKAEQDRARNQRTNRMLISMVVVFGIGWLPLNTINLLSDINPFPIPTYCWEYFTFIFFISHVLAMSSTCYNPFLYGCYNDAFQKEFTELIPALTYICCQSDQSNSGSSEENVPLNTQQHTVLPDNHHAIRKQPKNGENVTATKRSIGVSTSAISNLNDLPSNATTSFTGIKTNGDESNHVSSSKSAAASEATSTQVRLGNGNNPEITLIPPENQTNSNSGTKFLVNNEATMV